jgi:tetratricopeptide (TPR) repeat protein
MRKIVFLLALLAPLCASASDNTQHWTEVRSPHFTVLTNSNDRDGRRIASQFERMRAVFHVVIPSASDDAGTPIVVLALKDKKSFKALEPEAYLAKNQLDLAGLFLNAQDKDYVLVRLDAEGDHPYATVYHEYTHYLLRKADWLPLWLNEGLAEFYQNTDIRDPKEVKFGEPSPDDILYLRQSRLLPLTTLLGVDHNSPYYHDEQKGSVFYSESWALTHYIEITDFKSNTERLQNYAHRLAQHEDPVTAAQEVFGDLKKLEQVLNGYVQQSNFQEFRLKSPVDIPESSFAVRAVPGPEADAVRADVLLDVGRKKEAADLLESVLAADPKNEQAHETMGAMKFREHDIEAARKWYGEAVQLDSKSYLALYYFATMTLQSGDRGQDEAIEKSLLSSIEFNPKFAPSYDALAHFYASRHTKMEQAHKMSVQAVTLEPENVIYRMNAAEILAEGQDFKNALLVLQAAVKVAKSPSEVEMVQSRIEQIRDYQERVESSRKAMADAGAAGTSVTMVTTTSDGNGARTIALAPPPPDEPAFPAGAPGAKHTASGVIHGVKCSAPTVLTLSLEVSAKPIEPGRPFVAAKSAAPLMLYSNNFYDIPFSTLGYLATGDLSPCSQLEGRKANIVYGEVTDARVAGQIVSVELVK